MRDAPSFSDLIFEQTGPVARITINRPDRLNAMTGHTMDELRLALEHTATDRTVGVVVLTGAGDRAFSAGGDIHWESGGGLEGYDWHLGRILVDHPKPIIARVSGYAIGAGNHLAYFCDFTIAADHSIFGQNGPRVGSPAGGYVVSHLASVLGHKRAREMWMLCRRYSAQQALDWGLINAVVPAADLDAEVAKWCDELLSLSPTVLRVVKASFRNHMESYMGANVSDMVDKHAPGFFETGEQQEGASAFLEKRAPDFSKWR
ncbi:enoyl-CoA hydratase-related protein [Actibacterium sp. D379-3]